MGKTTRTHDTLVRKSAGLYLYGNAGIDLRVTLKLIKGKFAVKVYDRNYTGHSPAAN